MTGREGGLSWWEGEGERRRGEFEGRGMSWREGEGERGWEEKGRMGGDKER